MFYLLRAQERVSQFVESLKQRAGLRQMAAALQAEVPLVYGALIGERDSYMARAIAGAGAGSGVSSGGSTGVSSGGGGVSEGMLVGVVGMMHLDGIEKHLVEDHGYKIVSTNCPRSSVNGGDALETNQLSPSRSFENVIIS